MAAHGRQHVSAVDTAVDILEALKEREVAGVTELAETLGVSKSNVHKHLVTLCDHGFLRRDGERYRLGFRFFEFGADVRNGEPLLQEACASLHELATITDEVATLLVRNGDAGVYIRSIDPERDGRPGVKEGIRTPLEETASGQAILACLDANNQENDVGPTEQPGETSEAAMLERSPPLAVLWVAETDESTGLREIAAPVTLGDGEPLGAVALFVDTSNVSESVEVNYRNLVKKTARTVSKRMGFRYGDRTAE